MADREKPVDAELVRAPTEPKAELQPEPPVVARLIVEIRSDGSRTIARGAIEDTASGQRTSIEARGDSPIQLALALAKSITQLPLIAARTIAATQQRRDTGERKGMRSRLRGLLGRRRDD